MATQTSDIDAVIAALRAVLQEAERSSGWLSTKIVNRWIAQLPGAWRGRWRRLYLRGDINGNVTHASLVGHVRATLAYLEAQRGTLGKQRPWWSFLRAAKRPTARAQYAAARITPSHPEPQAADADEETQPRPKWLN
ncbi:MAG TPA: hypothetical protein VLW88_13175 [Hyphomicrobium sp.]|jgi:hypothetical protein|nr:hypothetical protein [Hyphomicrobium sp.]